MALSSGVCHNIAVLPIARKEVGKGGGAGLLSDNIKISQIDYG